MNRLTRVFRGTSRAPRDADAALRGALLALVGGDRNEAERLLIAAAHFDSKAVEPYLALARIYRERGEVGRAIRIHQNLLLRLDPGSPEALSARRGLARDYRAGGFLVRAIEQYDALLEMQPRESALRSELLEALIEAGEYERALALDRRWCRRLGASARAQAAQRALAIARGAQAREQADLERRALRQARRLDPHCAAAWIAEARFEAAQGRARAAEKAWRRACAADPRSRVERARDLAAAGESVRAESELQAWLAERPSDLAAQRLLAGLRLAAAPEAPLAAELRALLGALDADERSEARPA